MILDVKLLSLVCCSLISHFLLQGIFALFSLYNMAGVTSPTHLLHSQATISSRVYQGYDARYNHSFEVSKNGDGLISVQKPSNEEQQARPVEFRVERTLIEQLVNAYFTEVAPLLPVITQAEFLAHSSPPPILLYSMCLVAAARREVPQQVFDSIRYTVNNIIRVEDVLSTASIVNVQSLLILSMTGDCHSQFVPTALSALWMRLGTAIRMVLSNLDQFNLYLISISRLKTSDSTAVSPFPRTWNYGVDFGVHASLVTDGIIIFVPLV